MDVVFADRCAIDRTCFSFSINECAGLASLFCIGQEIGEIRHLLISGALYLTVEAAVTLLCSSACEMKLHR